MPKQYEAQALDLLQKNVGENIDGYDTKSGKVVRWNKITNDYATGFKENCIKTMFPLRGGQNRFDKLRAHDEKES
jgi:hypothetical protein